MLPKQMQGNSRGWRWKGGAPLFTERCFFHLYYLCTLHCWTWANEVLFSFFYIFLRQRETRNVKVLLLKNTLNLVKCFKNCLSIFEVYNTVLLTIITMLCIRSSGFINLLVIGLWRGPMILQLSIETDWMVGGIFGVGQLLTSKYWRIYIFYPPWWAYLYIQTE